MPVPALAWRALPTRFNSSGGFATFAAILGCCADPRNRHTRASARCGHARQSRRSTPRQTRAAGSGGEFVVSNAIRRDKTKNPIFWTGTGAFIVQRPIPDKCLTNGICGLDYRLWWVPDTTRLRWAPNIDPARSADPAIAIMKSRRRIASPKGTGLRHLQRCNYSRD